MNPDCLACQLNHGLRAAPGGAIAENDFWRAEHCIGAFGIGSIVVKTKAHRENLWELTPDEARSLGPMIQAISRAIVEALGAERVYVSLWVDQPPYHVHFVLQPRYPGKAEFRLKGWRLQFFRLLRGKPDPQRMAEAAAKVQDYLSQPENL